jgi:DNA-binding response OmpR family regulator
VAVADDDSGFVRVLERRLTAAGWHVRRVVGPPDPAAVAEARAGYVVLDPDGVAGDPWEVLEECCSAPSVAVIVCTGPSTVAERVRGLRLGADDWVTKPCHPEEVVARLEVAERTRQASRAPIRAERAGELEVRPEMFDAFVAGRAIGLTRREFELLQTFLQAAGAVLPREELYERVWGYSMAHGDRSVDVFVRRLRTKLDNASPQWTYVHTHFGVGYRFEPEQTTSS